MRKDKTIINNPSRCRITEANPKINKIHPVVLGLYASETRFFLFICLFVLVHWTYLVIKAKGVIVVHLYLKDKWWIFEFKSRVWHCFTMGDAAVRNAGIPMGTSSGSSSASSHPAPWHPGEECSPTWETEKASPAVDFSLALLPPVATPRSESKGWNFVSSLF